jgi:hypothetical protein
LQAAGKAGTKRSQADQVAIKGGNNLPGRVRLERNVAAEPNE